jgi:hypothetical protein
MVVMEPQYTGAYYVVYDNEHIFPHIHLPHMHLLVLISCCRGNFDKRKVAVKRILRESFLVADREVHTFER